MKHLLVTIEPERVRTLFSDPLALFTPDQRLSIHPRTCHLYKPAGLVPYVIGTAGALELKVNSLNQFFFDNSVQNLLETAAETSWYVDTAPSADHLVFVDIKANAGLPLVLGFSGSADVTGGDSPLMVAVGYELVNTVASRYLDQRVAQRFR